MTHHNFLLWLSLFYEGLAQAHPNKPHGTEGSGVARNFIKGVLDGALARRGGGLLHKERKV